jgi:hypothetical protein
MKKLISPIMAIAITFSSISPVMPQKATTGLKARSTTPRLAVSEAVEFQNARALTDGSTVFIEWQTVTEKDNYGFYVYRVDERGKHLVDENIVPGSYFAIGAERTYGERYSIIDTRGSLESVYIVEAIKMDGSRSQTKDIVPVYTDNLRGTAGFAEADVISKGITGQIVENRPTYPKDLQIEMRTNELVPDLNTHKWVIAQPGVKIGVRSPGMYRVTAAELSAAGFNTASDPSLWQLYVEGNQQAIIVGAGGSYIEFYGEGIDRVESDTQGYYLIIGNSPGKRMQTRVARPNSGTVVTPRYDQTVVFKERTTYTSTIFNGDAENFWGRSVINSQSTTYSFPLSGVDPTASTARITVYFQGTSFSNHDVQLVLNGNAIGSATGTSQNPFSATFDIPVSNLVEGSNGLNMVASAAGDFSLFDRVEISYSRKFLADNGKVAFYTLNDRKATLEGFTSSNVRVFDLTVEGETTELTNLQFVPQGPTFGVELPAARGRRFVAFDQSAFLTAAAITPNDPELLSNPLNAANLVIIAYKDFMANAETWAQYRRDQGFAVKVVDVNEIYDEFNYGVLSGDSIKAFLQMTTTTWATAPDYVLLMGDTTTDPRNYRNFGFAAFVPSRMVDGTFEETASDEYLTDFNGDGLAEMAVGRIAARNTTVITTVLNKTQNWEQGLNAASLDRGGLFVCDIPDGWQFCGMNQTLINQLPGTMPNSIVRRGLAPPEDENQLDPNAQANVVAGINSGKLVVNYSGHGTAGAWVGGGFFANSTIPQLNNVNNESVFTMLTCLNGYFVLPTTNSLAENLVHATNGGAVAAWASTGQTTPDVQEVMATRFYLKFGEGQIPRLGDLIRDAKSVIQGGSDVRLSWTLLGDPMLKVREPAAPDFRPVRSQKGKLR